MTSSSTTNRVAPTLTLERVTYVGTRVQRQMYRERKREQARREIKRWGDLLKTRTKHTHTHTHTDTKYKLTNAQ